MLGQMLRILVSDMPSHLDLNFGQQAHATNTLYLLKFNLIKILTREERVELLLG